MHRLGLSTSRPNHLGRATGDSPQFLIIHTLLDEIPSIWTLSNRDLMPQGVFLLSNISLVFIFLLCSFFAVPEAGS
jgi:hypothetical protein